MSTGVAILGSTGSIGTQALDVIEAHPGRFRVVALAAGRRIDLLEEQVRRTRPRLVATQEAAGASRIKSEFGSVEVHWGDEGLLAAALHPEVEVVVVALVGAVGIVPTLAALRAGKRVALANKEALVAAGPLVREALNEGGARLLPVDSEHSAVFQCLDGEPRQALRRILLTASGGPFRSATRAEMERATVEEALNHPTWRMGGKITIDCATLMNKGLEVIEAHWLFDLEYDAIHVVVHPQSIVHSMVEFADGSILAQLGAPDMRIPIQYALCYPERFEAPWRRLRWEEGLSLTFEPPDMDRFPCLRLAYEAGKAGGTAPAVLNAANEVAVAAFLDGGLRLTAIADCVEHVLSEHRPRSIRRLDTVLEADAWAREEARRYLSGVKHGALRRGKGDAS